MAADPYAGESRRPLRRTARLRPPATWWPALRRTPVSLWNDDVSDYAAALTYYALLAVVPALLVTVLAFGMISPGTARQFVTQVTAYAPAESAADLHAVLSRVLDAGGSAWPLLVAGATSALWSASSYLAVFRRALHRMHRLEDRRSPWRKAHRIVLTALALLALLVAGSLALLLTGPLAEAAGRALGVGETAAVAWSVLRWPFLLCLVALLVVVLFHTGPVPARRRLHSLPGGALAAALWLVVSTGFTLYAATLSAYSRVYGSLAGVVVFLVWLWLSNLALLSGAQFTAELGKDAAGHSGGTSPAEEA
ncbi:MULTISPECIES: YihY/virulence factor BrkB family protein [unclassified Streptomyces]|uniref:YihY/virulence factor BrkB family protein n=1 Tax=unclassified Streptomyces TaxID=2593676 RepID=UPI001F0407C6|nr:MULTISPECIES: YihY/virulence factor BrkB family protein [unclassified Streptomyces]MCH0563019.1 YihY/virulence factor BrkB family protein [Streptomyces sp. MUM 2J]MCH0571979.1 YihY/virulence factor BrkB family protein [Streptomyces sp. MUM 136J]